MPPLQQIKRAPLINIGTHHRSWCVDRLVGRWLEQKGKRQVVVLGAGSDARFWRVSQVL
jgi:[phosphatase 2A protein]-leucine-carboxy methyltransferase